MSGGPNGNGAGNPIGGLIKQRMSERSLTLRKLSGLCDICPSTLSRIINGRQTAGLSHLKRLSAALDVPVGGFLNGGPLSGDFRDGGLARAESAPAASPDAEGIILGLIREILSPFNLSASDLISQIEKELKKCEQYARTDEGRRIIAEECAGKIAATAGAGVIIDELAFLRERFQDGSLSEDERAAAGGGLLYFILAVDVIPDYAFPLGYLDDAIAVSLVVKRLKAGG